MLKVFWCLSCLCSITDLHRERSLRSTLSHYVANIILAALFVCFILLLSLPNHFLYLAIPCAENFYELTAAEPSIEGLLRRVSAQWCSCTSPAFSVSCRGWAGRISVLSTHISPFVLIFPGSLHTLCSVPKPNFTLSLKKIVRDQQCHSKWQSLHSLSHLHGQEPHSSTGRCRSMKKDLPGALQHRELHVEQGNETPLAKLDCLLQMHWNIKVISKNVKRE